MLGLTAAFVAAAGAYNAVHGPRYTASLRMLVSPGAASLTIGQAPADGATLLVADHGQAARNLAALLSDPGLVARMLPRAPAPTASSVGGRARRLAEAVGLIDAPNATASDDRLAGGAFRAAALGDTDVLKLDLTSADARSAAASLSAVAAGTALAIGGAGEARAELARAQQRVRDAQAEEDALGQPADGENAGGDADRKTVLAQRIAAAKAGADQQRVALELARRGVASTDGAYRGGGWVGGGEGGKQARAFADLLAQKQALAGAAAPDQAAIDALDGKIAQLRAQNYRAVRARYTDEAASLTAKLAQADAAIAGDEAALRDLDARGTRQQLQAQARAAKQAQLAQARTALRAAEARIDAAWQEVGGVRVLSPALVPAAPDWPSPVLLLRLGALAGLAAGLLSAMLAERARRTIDYPADVPRRLGIEVLARLAEQKPEPAR